MQIVLKILVGISGLLLLLVGANWMFRPEAAAAGIVLDLDVDELIAVNTVRGSLGGLMIGSGLLCALGLFVRAGGRFLQSAAVLMLCVAAGRVFSLLVDGYTQEAILPLVAEVVMAAVLLFAGRPQSA